MITQALVRELFDYQDGSLTWKAKRNGTRNNQNAGHLNKNGYVTIQINGRLYRSHRIIFLWHHGYLPHEIDHINRIKNDNHIENLRDVSHSENCINRGLRTDSSSGVAGVYWDNQLNKWRARITVNKKRKSLGLFSNFDDATTARKMAEVLAKPNKIIGSTGMS
jgi:hypothetical protein